MSNDAMGWDFLWENKLAAFLVGGLLSPAILKILEWVLARPTAQSTQYQQLLDLSRKEIERLTAEQARLDTLLRLKNEQIESSWGKMEQMRDEIRSLRDQAQTLMLRNALLEQQLKGKDKEKP